MNKITVIGAGNMGSAIIASLVGADYDIVATAAGQTTLDRIAGEHPGVTTTLDNADAIRNADIIVLTVKPYVVGGVIETIRKVVRTNAVIVSVVAGISIADLRKAFSRNDLSYFRAIPNTAIRLGRSVTFISHDLTVSADTVAEIKSIFDRSGHTFVVDESRMAACTALASCGIAYFMRFIRALAEGSVELGLKADFATQIAALTADGAAAILAEGNHPEAEIDKVTTPGGLTIKGLNALEANGFTAAVIDALKASV